MKFLFSAVAAVACGVGGVADAFAAAKVGAKIPSVEIFKAEFPPPEDNMVNVADLTKGKNTIIVGLPGAFTPTWSTMQVPGYLENQDALKEAGVDEVIVYCVNDPAVMQAWGEDQGIEGSFVTFVSDAAGSLTKALDLEMTDEGPPSVGIIGRSKRFAIYAENGEIKHMAVSEGPGDPAGDDDPSQSLAPAVLEAVKSLSAVEA